MRHTRVARVATAALALAAVAGCSTPATSPSAPTPGAGSTRNPAATSTTTTTSTTSTTTTTPTGGQAPTTSTSRPGASAAGQARLDAALRDAAWKNDVGRAEALLARGADVNAKDETEQSAYLVATSEGRLELLRLALANGAKVDDKDSWNGTGLIRAAERGHALVVGELLRAGIDRDHVNRIGYQAVHEAVWLGRDTTAHVDTLRVLVAGGVELTRPSRREGLTPLQMARERGFDRLTGVLVKATTATRIADPDAALLTAAARGDADAVASALRAGADPEARDARRRTALLLAVTGDHVDAARVLVAMGADPDALDDRHDTPWLVTGVTGSVAMLEALLPAGPDLTIRNRYGGVSVIPASERGHVDYVRRVVRTGIDLDHVNDLGWTALLEAVVLGDGGPRHQEIVRILLAAGADRSIADKEGVTALEHARSKGYAAIARILEAP
jgi:ankyrin repeat protein